MGQSNCSPGSVWCTHVACHAPPSRSLFVKLAVRRDGPHRYNKKNVGLGTHEVFGSCEGQLTSAQLQHGVEPNSSTWLRRLQAVPLKYHCDMATQWICMRTCACGTEYSVWKNLTISSDLADMGPGPSTVLMLHGFPDTADVFRNQVRCMQQP